MGSMLMEPVDIEAYASIHNTPGNYSTICLSATNINSGGIFHHDNPLNFTVPLLLFQISLASLFILSISRILKPLGQPNTVIQILGGLALGPSFMGRLAGFTETIYPLESLVLIDMIAALGFMLYFFLIGVQMDPWILKRIEKKEFLIGFSTILSALSLSNITTIFVSSFINDPKMANSLFVVATMSSVVGFPIVAQYLTELKMVNSEFGRMALSSIMVSNSFGFFVIFVTTLCTVQSSEDYSLYETFSAVAIALVIAFVIRPIILWHLQRIPDEEPMKQSFICMILVVAMMTGFCSRALGLHIYFGPFVLGMAIPCGPPLGSALVEKLDFFNSWAIMPLYFLKNGLVIDIFSVKLNDFLVVQFIILVACIGKFIGALFSALHSKVPLRDAISMGLVTNFQGVMDLAMFKMTKQAKVINNEVFIILCMSMLVVTGTITPILRRLYDPLRRYVVYKKRTVLDMKPDSQLQLLACIHTQDNVWTTINLLEALHPSNRNPISVSVLHLVQLTGSSHPVLVPHKLARNNSSKGAISKSIVKAFRIFEQSYHGVVTLHPFTVISPYVTMHDDVCTMALERKASLIVIPFHKRFVYGKTVESLKAGVKTANTKILEMAPCSVAILIDRGLVKYSRPVLEAWCSYRVAVFFLGGPDDREALAMGVRMVGRPNITLTIIRLLEERKCITKCDHKCQRELDNEAFSEMRLPMDGNNRVMYIEQVVTDATGTVSLVRSMEDIYDLIIVGRRHDTRSDLILGLADWDEYTELGTIGDLFASQDFRSNANILIMQQHTNVLDEWHGVSKNYYDFHVSKIEAKNQE